MLFLAAWRAAHGTLQIGDVVAVWAIWQRASGALSLVVTNVPGPQFPLYVLGRELETVVPVAFLPVNHALALANFSYNGKMSFGLLGDFDALEDIDIVQEGLVSSLRELVDAANAERPQARRGSPEPTQAT